MSEAWPGRGLVGRRGGGSAGSPVSVLVVTKADLCHHQLKGGADYRESGVEEDTGLSDHKKEAVQLESSAGVEPELPHLQHADHGGQAGQAVHCQLGEESHLHGGVLHPVFLLRDEDEEENEGDDGDHHNNNPKEKANASPATVYTVPEQLAMKRKLFGQNL